MYFSGKVKRTKQFIQLEQPDRYHRMRKEERKPDAWTVFVEVMAIMLMIGVAIYILKVVL